MGLFDGMFNKKKKSQEPQGVPLEQNDQPEEKDKGGFIGFVLLDSPKWDQKAILDTLSRKWGIRPDPGDEEDASEPNIAVIKVNGAMVALSLMPDKVPDGEAERYAAANYFWKEAVEVTASHTAHILIAVVDQKLTPVEQGKLFVAVAASCLAQPGALGIYTSGTVLAPDHYLRVAEDMAHGELPIMDWIYVGLYRGEKGFCGYTYGLGTFGREELEVVDSQHAPGDIFEFLYDVCGYLLNNDVYLQHGETIGSSAEEKLPITRSPGAALDGMTLKIGF